MNRKLLYLTLIFVALLGFLHQMGSHFFLYWSLGWFDGLMHFLGGLSLGLLFISFRYPKVSFVSTVIFIIFVGGLWEAFEYIFDIANPAHQSYFVDTTYDMVFDVLGALTAGFIVGGRKIYE